MFHRTGIAELRAKQEAYGNKLDGKTVARIVGVQCFIFAIYTEFLFLHWWMALIVAVIALVISYPTLVIPDISIGYYRHGLEQRNIFMNNLTQALSGNQEQTLSTDLSMSKIGLWGEFKQDVDKLENTIQHSGHSKDVHMAFARFRNKYKEDTYFVQYLIELENANATGDYDPQTYDQLTTYHSDVFHEQQRYIKERKDKVFQFYVFLIIMLIAFAVIVFAFGWGNYVRTFAHSAFGWIGSVVFLIIMTISMIMEFKYAHDESLMTL